MVSIDLRFSLPHVDANASAATSTPVAASVAALGASSAVVAKSMLRPKDEPLGKTLGRIRMLGAPPKPAAAKKGTKFNRMTPQDVLARCPPAVLLDDEGQPLEEDMPCGEAFPRASTLLLGATNIRIRYNLPTITSVKAPTVVYAGLPAVCSGLIVLFSDGTRLSREWRVAKADGSGIDESIPPLAEDTSVVVPPRSTIGRKLIFRVRPQRDDCLWTEVDTPPVEAPDVKAFGAVPGADSLAPKPVGEHGFRVISYNLLHDSYANSTSSQSVYPFCTKEVLSLSYRRARIVQQLDAYKGDLLCLQEVGRDVHDRYYADVLSAWGLKSHLALKTGTTREGVVIAYRQARFEPITIPLVEGAEDRPGQLPMQIVRLSWDTLIKLDEPVAKDIAASHPHLLLGLKKVPTVGAILPLRDKQTGKLLLAVNTHLYYHPNGCHIRALQLHVLNRAVHAAKEALRATLHEPDAAVELVFAGDFNFTRTTGGFRLAATGLCLPDDTCWTEGLKFYFGCDRQLGAVAAAVSESDTDDAAVASDEEIEEAAQIVAQEVREVQDSTSNHAALLKSPPTSFYTTTLTSPLGPLQETHPTDEEMRFSNYALSFKACIDHIFFSSGIRCTAVMDQPTEAQLTEHVAIPSTVFPSDHVALVADMDYRE